MSERRQTLARRDLLAAAVAAAAALGGALGCGDTAPSAPGPDAGGGEDAAPGGDSFNLPSLGGAPDTAQGRAIAAFVDAVVPGAFRDPTGAPGGVDTGAPALFFDPTFPAASYVGVLVLLLDSMAAARFEGARFEALAFAQREQIVEAAVDEGSPLEFGVQLAKLAHLSSDRAARHLGYPGPNGGYVDDPELSFGKAMSRELTADGNLP